MAIYPYSDWVVTSAGDTIASAAVEIRDFDGGALSSVYDASGAAVTNPLTADADGQFTIWLEPGNYTVTTGSGASEASKVVNINFDPGILNVMDFGVAADGVTDDATEIQAAVDAAEAVQGVLYFPPGTYLTESQITVDSDYVTIKGAGRQTVVKTTSNVNIFRPTGVTGITIRDMTLEGNGTGSNQDGIRCINVTDSAFHNIRVNNVGHDGLLLISGCVGNSVVQCHVDGSGDDGFNVGGDPSTPSTDNTITACVAENCTNDGFHISDGSDRTSVAGCIGRSNGHGVGIYKADVVAISGCTFSDSTGYSIHTPSGPCTNLTIDGNTISGGTRGINIDAASKVAVSNNVLSAPDDYGIVFSGATGTDFSAVVADNIITGGCSVAGIFMSGAKNISITGNTVNSPGGDGFYVNSDATYYCTAIKISGNTVVDPGDEGIEVEEGSASEHITILGNTILNSTGRAIEYRGGPFFNIADNNISDGGDYPILVSASSLRDGKGRVCGNIVEGDGTSAGIRINNYNQVLAQGNVVVDVSGTAIDIGTGTITSADNIT